VGNHLRNFPKRKTGFDEETYNIRLNHPVFEKRCEGDVGLEMEMEGRGFTELAGWQLHTDGSLRGEGAREYVLDRPLPIASVNAAVDTLFDHLRKSKARYVDSNRTSTHVHLNAQGLKVNQLCSVVALWGIFEDVLVNWCGEYRVGNLFCLRFRDCDWGVEQLTTSFRTGFFHNFTENARYLALNPVALTKFGSLEFRSLNGTNDPERIKLWIDMLWRLYEAGKAYSNPEDIARDFSGLGSVGFLEKVFGRRISEVLLDYNHSVGENSEQLIWDGLRRMQSIIYSLPWGTLQDRINQIAIPNPFGVKLKKPKTMFVDEWVVAPAAPVINVEM
jgi:hypothetical protein